MTTDFTAGGRISSSCLNEHQAKQFLKTYGIPVVHEIVTLDTIGALDAAHRIGYPVVLKGLGARLLHKTERDLVCLHIYDDDTLTAAAEKIEKNAGDDLEGFLVQPQVGGQREFMAGLFQDAQFGPVALFGVGGVLTEAIEDVNLGLAPLAKSHARLMIDGIRARRLLGAFRGEMAVNQESLVNVLMGISRIAGEHPEIAEIDINPLRIDAEGNPLALDALVVYRQHIPKAVQTLPVSPEAIGGFFYPRSIAFIGASDRLGKWGNFLVANTISGGYQGRIYLVNPRGGRIMGRRVFKTVIDIPDPVDLAVVTVPANSVFDLIEPLRKKGVPSMVLISSGFRETGPRGADLETRLTEAARAAGILILGPNTMGITNPHIDLHCSGALVTPRAGASVMVSQSGNMGNQLLTLAEKEGIGIRGFCGSGNEAMITIEDYIESFEDDDLTRVVILYIESIKNGRRFFEAATRVSRKKPIILLKGGQSDAGGKAAAGHTGAMASDRRVFSAACRQSGIIKVDASTDLLDLAAAFASLPLPKGPRTAIMTWGGGWGVIAADLCQNHGLEVPELDRSIISDLNALLPSYWSRSNPVDLVGEQDLSLPMVTLEKLMRWEGCDAVINLGILGRIHVAQQLRASLKNADASADHIALDDNCRRVVAFEEEFIAHSVALMERFAKPVIGVYFLKGSESKTVYRVPNAVHKAVFYETPERAVNALAKMALYRRQG